MIVLALQFAAVTVGSIVLGAVIIAVLRNLLERREP